MKPRDNEPFHSKYGDPIRIDGWLWELTYSEMAPPDSRQHTGMRCPTCEKQNKPKPGAHNERA